MKQPVAYSTVRARRQNVVRMRNRFWNAEHHNTVVFGDGTGFGLESSLGMPQLREIQNTFPSFVSL